MKRQRYFIQNFGENLKPLIMAIDFATKQSSERVWIVIHDESFKRNLQIIGLIKNEIVDKLTVNDKVCEIISLNKFLKSSRHINSIVITIWLSSDNLFEIDEMTGLTTIICIPLSDNLIELWAKTYGPTDITTNESLPVITITNNDLRDAFDNLNSNYINWRTLHSQDIKVIKNLINKFKDSVDPIEIFSYLSREKHLNYKRALEIRDWTNNLINGKKC